MGSIMKIKNLIAFCTIFLLPYSIQAECVENTCCDNSCETSCCDNLGSLWNGFLDSCTDGWSTEIRVAYYHPVERKVRKIYSYAFANWQLEIGKRVTDDFQVWAAIDTSSNHGHSLGLHDKTHLRLTNCNFGLKYLYSLDCSTEVYLGAGMNYGILRITDHSDYVREHTDQERLGGLLKAGVNYYITCNLFVDFFFDYLFQEFKFKNSSHSDYYVERHNLQMSGYKTGVGIGYKF